MLNILIYWYINRIYVFLCRSFRRVLRSTESPQGQVMLTDVEAKAFCDVRPVLTSQIEALRYLSLPMCLVYYIVRVHRVTVTVTAMSHWTTRTTSRGPPISRVRTMPTLIQATSRKRRRRKHFSSERRNRRYAVFLAGTLYMHYTGQPVTDKN